MSQTSSRRRFMQDTFAAGTLGVSATFTGCTGLSGSRNQQSEDNAQVIKLSKTFSDETFDPLTASWLPRWIGLQECLLQLNNNLQLTPGLAKSWNRDDGGRSWRFKLRENVTFHDGEPLNAKAAELSLKLSFNDPESFLASVPVTSITAENEYVLRIKLASPFAPLPGYVSHNGSAIISPKSLKNGNITVPKSTGPFKVQSWESGTSLTAVRNQDYYGSSPKIDRVEYEVVTDGKTRELKLLDGELNMIWNQPVSSVNSFRQDANTNVYTQQVAQTRCLAFNTTSSPFKNAPVRKAANYALNETANVKNVLNGVGELGIGPWPPDLYWANDRIEPYKYDKKKAAHLLTRTGWTKRKDGIRYQDGQPLSITLHTYPKRPNFRTLAEAMQSQLQKVGFDVNIKLTDWSTMMDAKKNKNYDVTMEARTTFAYPPDPENLVSLYHSEDSYMDTGYKNERVDNLLEKGRQIQNRTDRKQIYDQVQEIVMEDLPISYQSYITKVHGTRSVVQGFTPDHPIGNQFYLNDVLINNNQ